MMSSSSTAAAAGAVGGKSARACDSCLRRRARWYCAADDAFLCQACDASVHSANPLARRHERLRLRPASPSSSLHDQEAAAASTTKQVAPGWSRRKARSRRPHVKSVGQLLSSRTKLVVVPEVAADESEEERGKAEDDGGSEEEQLLYHRVPSFDRALAELCSQPASCREENANKHHLKEAATATTPSPVQRLPDCGVAGFGPTDAELREFAADMEALLGQGMDDSNELMDESFYMESLGLMTTAASEDDDDAGRVKKEHDGGAICNRSEGALGFGRAGNKLMKSEASAEVVDIDFNDDEDSSEQKAAAPDAQFLRRSLDLRLNYEAVIESWGTSPWTDGQRPQVRLDDFWPHHAAYSGSWPAGGGRPPLRPRWGADGCREARVSRYREKRRTRLFAKKIRYEVRKLNAEKRPRMKGRFVKRPAAAGGGAAVTAAAAPCAVTT